MPNKILSGVTFDPARKETPARVKAKKGQVKSDQGAYVFKVDDLERVRRFIILGAETSFYAAGQKVAMENAVTLQKLAKTDAALQVIDIIEEISVGGRAPKQSPGLFALALIIGTTPLDTVRAYGYSKLPAIARTASTLFEFTGYLEQFKPLGGTGFKKAVGRWYSEKSTDQAAYQMVKYRQRDGMDHARLLRLSKYAKSGDDATRGALYDWALGKPVDSSDVTLPRVVEGFERAKTALPSSIPGLIREYGLSWEMIPTEALNDRKVWDALLDGNLPLGALIRQLPRLTNLGIISELGGRTAEIEDRLTDRAALKKARIHPIGALTAQRTYASGHGRSQSWTPVRRIVSTLEDTFYGSFDAVEPTGRRLYLGLDVSASMHHPRISESVPLVPMEASAVMAMVVARTEREHYFGAFQDRVVPIDIDTKDSLSTVIGKMQRFPFAGTNLSLPMLDAAAKNLPVDAFIMYTDNQQGLGKVHPFQALEQYRRKSGIQAKIVVNAMTATRFTMADPSDKLALDIAGFDTAAPGLIAEFVR